MKNFTLVLAAFLLSLVNVTAKTSTEKVFDDVNKSFSPIINSFSEPIVFMERGIEFYVFPNGEFDFNTVPTRSTTSINTTYGAPRGNAYGYHRNRSNNIERGIRIEHDYNGRVRRIGNVFINYDAQGRVKRVGSVYMRYNNFALAQVGGLQLIYDRRGNLIDIRGCVNNYSQAYHYNINNNHYGATRAYTSQNGYYYGNSSNTNDFYYYKQSSTVSNDDKLKK